MFVTTTAGYCRSVNEREHRWLVVGVGLPAICAAGAFGWLMAGPWLGVASALVAILCFAGGSLVDRSMQVGGGRAQLLGRICLGATALGELAALILLAAGLQAIAALVAAVAIAPAAWWQLVGRSLYLPR